MKGRASVLGGKATVFAKAPGRERGWGVRVGDKPPAPPSQTAQNQRGAQMHDFIYELHFFKVKGRGAIWILNDIILSP